MPLVNNHKSAEKEDLSQWVSLAWKRALTHDNIKVGFLAMGIWPFNLHAMDFKLRPSLSFHLGLDGLHGENNGNDHEGNHGNHEQEDENFRVEKIQKDFDANANETHCHCYVNDIAHTFENNVEDATFENLTNSRMNNMAIKLDQQQSLQVNHPHTTSRFLSLPKISSTK
jgi:hypothetical protein